MDIGQADGQTDGWMKEQMDRETDEQTDKTDNPNTIEGLYFHSTLFRICLLNKLS